MMKIEIVKTQNNRQVDKILSELDSLYEELGYYNDEDYKDQYESTELKIKVREELLRRISF